MRFSRLFWKLFLVYTGLNLALLLGFLTVSVQRQQTLALQQARQRLHDLAIVLSSHVGGYLGDGKQEQLGPLVQRLAHRTSVRMTVIDGQGQVLADSQEDPRRMENHRERPEFREAASTGRAASSERRSPTLGTHMLYLALPLDEPAGPDEPAGLVRVATDLRELDAQLAAIRRSLGLLATAGGLLAIALTYWVASRIVRPLHQLTRGARAVAAGEENHPIVVRSRDEVGMLAASFNQMQTQLSHRLQQLRENSEWLTTVLGSMDEGVIAVDAQQRILLANQAGRSLLDFALAGAVGRGLLEATPNPVVHEAVAEVFQTGRPCQRECETTGVHRRVLALRATPLPGDPCPGVVVVLHDLSEMRRLVNLRRELVANVSHELKTPLASIKAYAETLRLGAVNDPQHNLTFVGRIEEQAERLHQLILDLLQLARVESGQETFEITEVPLDAVVQHCLAQYADVAAAKQIRLQSEPPDTPVRVRADEEGLQTVLGNLVDNALKYTPQGGTVLIRWRQQDSEAVLEVQDTGIGIALADQSRVFERFYRADKARSRELGGTGLGLSIVKHLVQAFGGSVGLESGPQQGTTFRIRLPQHAAEASTTAKQSPITNDQ